GSHEAAAAALAPDRPGHLDTLRLAPGLFLVAVPDRAQDELIAERDRAASLHACLRPFVRLERRDGVLRRLVAGKFHFSRLRPALRRLLHEEPANCRLLHAAAAADRLSDRLCNDPRATTLAGRARRSRHSSVLDLFPDPHLCLDEHSPARRPA